MLFVVTSKFPYYCGCGFFVRSRNAGYKHRRKCSIHAAVKTKALVTTELVFDMANMQIDQIENNFRSAWKERFGSVTNCPIK